MNLLPKNISDDTVERIILIGSSLLMLKSKKIDHTAYSTRAFEVFKQLKLEKGEMDELPMVSPTERINWKRFDQVLTLYIFFLIHKNILVNTQFGRQYWRLCLGNFHYKK